MKWLGKVKAKHSHKCVHSSTGMGQLIPHDAPTDKDGYLILDTPMKKEIEYRCSKAKERGVKYLGDCKETLKIVYEDDLLTEIHFEGDVINDTKTIEVWRKAGW